MLVILLMVGCVLGSILSAVEYFAWYCQKALNVVVLLLTCLSQYFTIISFVQYYDNTFASAKEQKAFEKNLFNKTHRANGMLFTVCFWCHCTCLKFECFLGVLHVQLGVVWIAKHHLMLSSWICFECTHNELLKVMLIAEVGFYVCDGSDEGHCVLHCKLLYLLLKV